MLKTRRKKVNEVAEKKQNPKKKQTTNRRSGADSTLARVRGKETRRERRAPKDQSSNFSRGGKKMDKSLGESCYKTIERSMNNARTGGMRRSALMRGARTT